MSKSNTAASLNLLRPHGPTADYDKEVPHYRAALILAVTGLMVIAVVTAFSGPVASWVSDLTDPAKASIVESRTGRIEAYQAWLTPLFFVGLRRFLRVSRSRSGASFGASGSASRPWTRRCLL